jgi:hypothetical protein
MLRRSIIVTAGFSVAVLVSVLVVRASGSGSASKAPAAHGLAALSSVQPTSNSTSTSTASYGPHVIQGTYRGVSPAVRSLPAVSIPPAAGVTARDNESLRPLAPQSNVRDPVVQSQAGTTGGVSSPIANFDGICLPFGPPCAQASSCSCLPPDTNGEAGATQYVEMVNTDFAVYSKTGKALRASTPINKLWANTQGECKSHPDGDPVVVYDQLAKRWVLSEFIAFTSGNEQYGECIAVSTTGDATGSYYLYEFLFGSDVLLDYPKIGVWPDGYYMMANEFPSSSVTSSGTGVFAFERSKMLAGKPARVVYFDDSVHNPPGGQYIGMLPSDLDGSRLPPAGTPNYFTEVDDPSGIPPTTPSDLGFTMRIFKFHVDWTYPSRSTFGANGAPNYSFPVAPFARPQCVYGYGPNCVPQKGGPQDLDTLGDRLMFRLPYRNFGTYASLVLNHTVVAPDGRDGIRWYEVRIPTGKAPRIYQQGTYAPGDATGTLIWRWMGSIAMDKVGNIGLGFSASGPTKFPSVRYSGHVNGRALGYMTAGEKVAFTGTGPQTEAEGRWGDYSDLTVDPVDDCTFWYAQEYLADDFVLIGTWRTRIVSFRFPNCA